VNVNVLSTAMGLVDSLPTTSLLPPQAPEAVQVVASRADQSIVVDSPTSTVVGFAESSMIGTGSAGGEVCLPVVSVPSEALQPTSMLVAKIIPATCRKTILSATLDANKYINPSPK
jgi:hypothetical protein